MVHLERLSKSFRRKMALEDLTLDIPTGEIFGQRGILFRENGEWKVRATGQQGSGVLRSMAEANCFIVLEHERGAIAAGDPVSVQPFDGLA
jgi:molybdopterin biosynthesis enzyme